MRYSIRTILVCVLLVAVVLGVFSAYDRIWRAHCKAMEPSLFAFVLQREIDTMNKMVDRSYGDRDKPEVKIYLSHGCHEKSGVWIPPSKSLVDAIGLNPVVSVTEADGIGEENVVHYIENIRWVDWNTAILDFGWNGGTRHGSEVRRGIKLTLVDDLWEVSEEGGMEFQDPKPAG